MKRTLFLIAAILIAVCTVVAAFGCEDATPPHEHLYDQQVVDTLTLASEATCTAKARYYYSCSCGEKGTETFEVGEPKGHHFDKEVVDTLTLASEATCTEKARYYYSCSCGEKGTETFEVGEPKGHHFDKEVVDTLTLASEATCTEKARYYHSCECGEIGSETFEVGEPNGHHVVVDEAVEPTFDAPGATEGSHCDVCNAVLVAQEEVAQLKYEDYAYVVTFDADERVKIYLYDDQDYTKDPAEGLVTYSRSKTGELTKEDGQINFKVVVEEGYQIASLTVTEGYKNLKGPSDTENEGTYRITKITADLTVTVRSEEETLGEGYTVTFTENANLQILVYKDQDYTADPKAAFSAYSYNVNTGAYDKGGDGQVNFKVVMPENYLLRDILIEGDYKNLKDQGDGIYRITKITSDLTVNVRIYDAHDVHEYTVQDTSDRYLVKEADCSSPATYYYSCRCGEAGTETFEYGLVRHDLTVASLLVEGHEEVPNCIDLVCNACSTHFYVSASYENTGMPIMDLAGTLDDVTKDSKKKISLVLTMGDLVLDCDATIKVQGATSSTYPKKNYSLQFFKKDTNYDKKQKVELFEGCGAQSKYCLKADYVDTSHTRNLVGAEMAREVVQSRGDIDELYALANAGLTDGFPILVYNNGRFYGLYSLVIPKDKWMYDMDDDETVQSAIFNTTKSGCSDFASPSNYEFTNGFDLEFCSTEDTSGTAWVTDSINDLIDFLINNDGEDFVNGIGEYLSVERAIDVLLCTEVLTGWDNVTNNVMMVTYDGKKWLPSMYDMDTCFGWSKTDDFDVGITDNLLFKRILENFRDEVEARYLELRATVFTAENFEKHMTALCDATLDAARVADHTLWTRGMDRVNVKAFVNHFRNRLAYLDGIYAPTV